MPPSVFYRLLGLRVSPFSKSVEVIIIQKEPPVFRYWGGDETMQMYGKFEGFTLRSAIFDHIWVSSITCLRALLMFGPAV